ncbi:GNAT family N-acetyltransferase [Tropicibacter sp. R15_0]|uniref:GNAT family N-acetyltransferase n=1 Tax=Tropicibacter sp. R15_0 TaxID=2821101 RepID=UPI001ADC76C9|nr:GNAT family N-acetyltransferase [Tropicibacter sp. R15_0]MBO9464166.1 GNAT family N-acetyltransferase [Tropicibacter sp. R15_0]
MTRTLSTERLILRPPAPKDAAATTAFYQTERSQYVGGYVPEFRAFSNFCAMLGHWEVRGYGLWAVTTKESDDIVGLVGPYYPQGWPETEIGWLMFDGSEGKGFAFEAAQAAIQDARDTLGWTNIVHYIAPENARSITLAERLGAQRDPSATVPKPEDPCLVYRQPIAGVS